MPGQKGDMSNVKGCFFVKMLGLNEEEGMGGFGDFPPVCEDPAGLDCCGWPINNTVGITPHPTHMLQLYNARQWHNNT